MSGASPDAVDVRSLDAVRTARGAVAEYREVASRAIAEAVADAERGVRYLTSDLRVRWEQERRRKERMLNHLKSELARAELQAQGSMVSTREERSKVDRCAHDIQMAGHKIEAIRRWSARLERDLGLFRGQVQALSRLIEGDLKRGEADLALAVDRLEAYLAPTLNRADPRGSRAEPPPEPDDPETSS